MVEYRNVKTGRVLERPMPDAWLEASDGWARVEPPVQEMEPEPSEDNEGSKD